MEYVNNKYTIKATIVSPLYIGQGGEKDWVEGIDYIRRYEDETWYLFHLDINRIFNSGVSMEQLTALYANRDSDGIKRLLRDKVEDVYDLCLPMPVESTNPIRVFNLNPVTERHILFGSSLKGAIRSALFHQFSKEEKVAVLKEQKNKLNDLIFGSLKDGSDFMRFIRIGDFDFDFEATELVNTKIYNLHKEGCDWIGGWKHDKKHTDCVFKPTGFNTVYECLMPSHTSEGVIMLSPLLYNRIHTRSYKNEKDRIMSGNPISRLFSAINQATKDYLNKEIKFFEKYPEGDNADLIIDALKKHMLLAESFGHTATTGCLIKMSAGAGFHSITGDWQYEDYSNTGFNKGAKLYKSRKIACHDGAFSPMGLLKLELI